MPVILAIWWRQESRKFKVILGPKKESKQTILIIYM